MEIYVRFRYSTSMKNFLTSTGPFSASFRFFGVLPRECWGYELDRLHMGIYTYKAGKLCPMFTVKTSSPLALVSEEIKL